MQNLTVNKILKTLLLSIVTWLSMIIFIVVVAGFVDWKVYDVVEIFSNMPNWDTRDRLGLIVLVVGVPSIIYLRLPNDMGEVVC